MVNVDPGVQKLQDLQAQVIQNMHKQAETKKPSKARLYQPPKNVRARILEKGRRAVKRSKTCLQ
jgi:hypothetical protein